jgi:alkanesulfonate monooxygenase SsuD/methylene tetrahydromethanopterin reductase-like flavin-dependent oxidoreductase (luciferase family)
MSELRCGVFLPNFGPFFDPNELGELAVDAEAAGWDGFFIWDHIAFDAANPQPVVDPWVALAVIAARTSRIRLGALVTPLARRRPWKLARETVSLDHLSHGRMVVGAGLGWAPDIEFEAFGEDGGDRARADLLDEGLEVLDGLWKGEAFVHDGAAYHLDVPAFLPRPLQEPRIPVWIAGLWPHRRPFRRAARWDGVYPEKAGGGLLSPSELSEIVAYVREHGARTERYDVVLNGHTDGGDAIGSAAMLETYIERGLTWWLEKVEPTRLYSVAEARERIRQGPPWPSGASQVRIGKERGSDHA